MLFSTSGSVLLVANDKHSSLNHSSRKEAFYEDINKESFQSKGNRSREISNKEDVQVCTANNDYLMS